jgi:flavin reductase (DIM6/NTAB) family NADH-FMN oxidoreductase RutF
MTAAEAIELKGIRMKTYPKKNFPLTKIRRFLEPGPIVLVSSAHKGKRNIMTLGWHLMLGFEPALVGCYIWDHNHSFEMIRRSKQCVINVPTFDMVNAVIGIGNCSGSDTDKFKKFKLTPVAASQVEAPLIAECYASFECELTDASLINKYSLFIFEVVKAHAASSPRYPKTVHYRGDGVFMVSGRSVSYRRRFKPVNL